MKASFLVPLAALATVVGACAKPAPPQPDENAIRTALTAQLAKLPAIIVAKDTAALANLFTQDATWILPDASTFTGRARIDSGASAFFASYQSLTMSPLVIDKLVVVSDSEAVTFAHGNYTMTVKGKKPESFVNPFADLWKKGSDGVWRAAYEVNANGPAAPAAPPKH
ncbi:MAG TPA: SgcJ/EcaC family oxidoreductase [Gemmatimonadales bacterium]|nr:SgcJ/EcaC family oxidoreductase [Gemmatimonadales bacterium]